MKTTFERLGAVLAKNNKVPSEHLSLDAPLESLGIDSLGTLELFWNIEEEFRISLPNQPVTLPTVRHVVQYVDALVSAQSASPAPGDIAPATPPAVT
jgi:acyl carrier protein